MEGTISGTPQPARRAFAASLSSGVADLTSYTPTVTFDAFPGYALVREGLHDLEVKRETIPALLVLIGAPRLRKTRNRGAGFEGDRAGTSTVRGAGGGGLRLRAFEVQRADPRARQLRTGRGMRRLCSS